MIDETATLIAAQNRSYGCDKYIDLGVELVLMELVDLTFLMDESHLIHRLMGGSFLMDMTGRLFRRLHRCDGISGYNRFGG